MVDAARNPLTWEVKKLDEMDPLELYGMLKLRVDVFVVEQDCVYPDLDGKDHKALHVIGKRDNQVVACTRIFQAGDYFKTASFGRVVVDKSVRRFHYGHDLIDHTIEAIEQHFGSQPITISAQEYLLDFYQKHGFKQQGDGYLEDGIPHVRMVRD